jgi:hypothetical protein
LYDGRRGKIDLLPTGEIKRAANLAALFLIGKELSIPVRFFQAIFTLWKSTSKARRVLGQNLVAYTVSVLTDLR